MANRYQTASQISFKSAVTIQMGATGGNQLSNAVPADTLLVLENGIWKYPKLAAAGAVVVTARTRLTSVVANLGASTAWTLMVAGNTANVSNTPYPAADVALYTEPTLQIATGTGQYLYLEYPSTALPVLLPGQRVYMTTAAGTAPSVRFSFGGH